MAPVSCALREVDDALSLRRTNEREVDFMADLPQSGDDMLAGRDDAAEVFTIGDDV
jgi:hypothetical protein